MLCTYRLLAFFVGLIAPLCAIAKPVISGIANVASYSNGPVSPGAMVVVFGSGFGPSQLINLQLHAEGHVATTLSGVQVLFDGIAAPLIYVSQSQIAAVTPYGVSGRTTTEVQVSYAGVTSHPLSKAVAATAPGIFSADASGKGQAAITNSDGSVNSPANPGNPGSYVTVYLTGEGQTNPPSSDGAIASVAANVSAPVSVRIAGRPSQVLYAGSAPGNVNGFAQVNIVIPADLQYGGNLPIVVQIGEASSQSETTVAVSGPPAPLPGAPLSATAIIDPSNQAVVNWTPADHPATRFHVERRIGSAGPFTEVAVVPSTAFSFTDTSVAPGMAYQYRIRAGSDYGFSGYSAVASVSVPATQTSPPSNFQAVAVSQTQVNLMWNPANTNATNFQIERKTGAAGTYAILSTLPGTATSYADTAVVASTAYIYRIRSQGASGVSAYSSEVSATTPAVPLPSAPTLQATVLSSSQIRLVWTSTATSVVRFRIERRLATTQYAEINQPGPSIRTFDDGGLSASTVYFYRIRVETGAGLSPYSNEVNATTSQGLPGAPTSLRAVAASSTVVNLTWTNSSSDVTTVRVEARIAGSSTFTDIGATPSLTSTTVTNNQPNTTYTFRVRAQNAAGFSAYSNEATVTTHSVPRTVFLIHGLAQGRQDMQALFGSLTGSLGIDPTRFRVDASFDFSECANTNFCSSSCSITAGAQKLAQYIADANPPGDIVLIGFSMGGLIARDMIANNRLLLNGRKLSALITLGTPNLGYPYTALDTTARCTPLVQAMDGNWRSQQANNTIMLSPYLSSLTDRWPSASYPGSSGLWLAASGRSCSNPKRTINSSTGCRDGNPYSDGVVCDDSATYAVNTPNGTGPNRNLLWRDPSQIYVHTNEGFGASLILCGNDGQKPTLSNPPVFGPLFAAIKELLDGL